MIAGGFALLALNGCFVGASLGRIITHCVLATVFLGVGIVVLRPRKE